MRKKEAKLRVRVFMILLVAPTVLWIFLSLIGATKILDYDTGEKRVKHQFEGNLSLTNLTQELESHYNDRVPFRSILLDINKKKEWMIELPYTKLIEPIFVSLVNKSLENKVQEESIQSIKPVENTNETKDTNDSVQTETEAVPTPLPMSSAVSNDKLHAFDSMEPVYETPNDSGYYPYKLYNDIVISGRDDWMFNIDSIHEYKGDIQYSDDELLFTSQLMQMFSDKCRTLGAESYFVFIPDKISVYPEYLPTVDFEPTLTPATLQLADYVNTNTNVNCAFIGEQMLKSKAFGRLYFTHDTHWNGLGALSGLNIIHYLIGLEPIDMINIEKSQGYIGSIDLINLAEEAFENHIIDYDIDVNYKPEIEVTMVYADEDSITEYQSNASDQRTVVVIGDSFRNHLTDYLPKDFAHTYFVNQMNIDERLNELISSADLVIYLNVQRSINIFNRFEPALENAISVLQ